MSNNPPSFSNAPNNQPPMQNSGMGMQNQPHLGVGNHQNQNFRPPFMPNMQPPPMNPPAFMNAANHTLPLQNNQMHLPHMGFTGPQQGQLGPQNSVGNANYNPMFPLQGQVMPNAAQMNLSQLQGLAQGILNILQQPNMSMNIPNSQFCAPYPVQNMNQQLPMQVPNPSQVVQNMNQQLPMQMPVSNPSQVPPYGMHPSPRPRPMFGFPNQVPQPMFPQNQNPMFSANPQLGHVPGNQVRPQIDPNQKNLVPPNVNTNAFASSPFSSQQLQGNSSAPVNPNLAQPHHTTSSQPSAVTSSQLLQGNPNNNIKTNVPNSNWKGPPSKNFKNNPNRGGFQRGFQRSKFGDVNNGKRGNRFPEDCKEAGANNRKAGHAGLNSEELQPEAKRSFKMTYSEQEIQQWREARRKNHPFNENIQKSENQKDFKVIDRSILQKELREVIAKQVELGFEVPEIPSYYLKDSENQDFQSEGKNSFTDKRKFQNKFNKKSDRRGRFGKKQKFSDRDISENRSLNKRKPTLLQKLLSADIKRDKSHLLQVFRFMVTNSFFKESPDKPLIYPSVVVKEIESVGRGEENHLHTGKDALECGNEKTVQNIVNHNIDNGHDSEDGESDDDVNDSVHINPHKDSSSLFERECDDGEGISESDEEEGEIIE